MTLEEYYNMEKEYEEHRHKCPCCENCIYYYEEYGYANCKKHDIPEECADTEKCNDWA